MPSGERRQAKYASSALRPASDWGPARCVAYPAKYMSSGFWSLKVGHCGTPLPFGSPYFAKFVQ